MIDKKTSEELSRLLHGLAEIQTHKPVRCCACNGPTVEIIETHPPFQGPTGIYRCLLDECDAMTDPTFREE